MEDFAVSTEEQVEIEAHFNLNLSSMSESEILVNSNKLRAQWIDLMHKRKSLDIEISKIVKAIGLCCTAVAKMEKVIVKSNGEEDTGDSKKVENAPIDNNVSAPAKKLTKTKSTRDLNAPLDEANSEIQPKKVTRKKPVAEVNLSDGVAETKKITRRKSTKNLTDLNAVSDINQPAAMTAVEVPQPQPQANDVNPKARPLARKKSTAKLDIATVDAVVDGESQSANGTELQPKKTITRRKSVKNVKEVEPGNATEGAAPQVVTPKVVRKKKQVEPNTNAK